MYCHESLLVMIYNNALNGLVHTYRHKRYNCRAAESSQWLKFQRGEEYANIKRFKVLTVF